MRSLTGESSKHLVLSVIIQPPTVARANSMQSLLSTEGLHSLGLSLSVVPYLQLSGSLSMQRYTLPKTQWFTLWCVCVN